MLLVAEPGSGVANLVGALGDAKIQAIVVPPPRSIVGAATLMPDAVIIDAACSAPWDGILASLHREPQTRSIPVAIFSHDPGFDIVRAVASGACDVFAPPLDHRIIERVQALLAALALQFPTGGGGPGVDAAFRLLEFVSRARFTGSLVQLARGTGAPEGTAIFRNGDLVNATFGNIGGHPALCAMLSLPPGSSFLVREGARPPAPTIAAPAPPSDSIPSIEPALEALELVEIVPETDRILIVDDDESIAALVAERLGKEGFQTRIAADGAEGVRSALDWRPDAIVSDLEMPVLDGWGLLRAVRADARIAETPLLFLSAAEHFRESLRAGSAGAQAYIAKSEIRTIADQVRAALSPRRRFLDLLGVGSTWKPASSRAEIVGARWALEAAALRLPAGKVLLRDSWGEIEVRFAGGGLISASAKRGGAVAASGPTAAQLVNAMRRGEISVVPEDAPAGAASAAPEPSIRELLEAGAEQLNARTAALLDKTLSATRLQVDPGAAALYEQHGPPTGRAILQQLRSGAAPGAILDSAVGAPEVEEALRDLVRRGVVGVARG